ncbi:MAG TPA: serine/threonine-protein kinase [Bryobacteraceae bacterium]|nr:serine/threonine-protein kinase [Bryobacteraceae bacterium]
MSPGRWSEVKAVLSGVLDAPPAERPALLHRLCGVDAELRTTVESLLAMESKGDWLETGVMPGASLWTDAPAKPPEHIGPYNILNEIGRGGMGVVYLADRADGEYRKRVAIKLITTARPERDTEQRFRRERQILAQLEHPGIARLLDGGATESGQPYFVMEYVEGPTLPAWCDEHHLNTIARVKLFLAVCNAVAYAHQQLIVHRDLKPGNILVTPSGEPKLLDFGLARAIDSASDVEITLAGPAAMTVAYASPEQIRGERQTVASDVYSLGVILYELLTGHRPYRVDNPSYAEMVRVAFEQEPVPPSEHRRDLSGDLETILLKALAKDPAQRYPTVDEFAADLRRHLDGQPIHARPAAFFYRAGKFLRRHRIALPAASLAVALILAFAGLSWFEALRAQRRFNDVQSLAHSVLYEFHDAIANLPGSTAARELLVHRALEYLENLSREAGGDPRLAREIALGYMRIGEVQGAAGVANLGRVPASLESYRKAENILAGLMARSPSDALLRQDYLRAADGLARSYISAGDSANARTISEKDLALAKAAADAHPNDPSQLYSLMLTQSTAADLLVNEKKYDEAIPVRQSILDLETRIASLKPGDEGTRSNLALAHKKLGALYGVMKRYPEANREYEAARAIDEQVAAANPRAQLDLSYDYSDLGWVAIRLGDLPAALALYRKGLELRQAAAAADPRDMRAATAVASSTGRIGYLLRLMGDLTGALDGTQHAIVLWKQLADRPGAPVSASVDLAEAHTTAGQVYIAMKAFPRAAAEYEQAMRIYLSLKERGVLPQALYANIDNLRTETEKCKRSACIAP